jgi:hypothetical protein
VSLSARSWFLLVTEPLSQNFEQGVFLTSSTAGFALRVSTIGQYPLRVVEAVTGHVSESLVKILMNLFYGCRSLLNVNGFCFEGVLLTFPKILGKVFLFYRLFKILMKRFLGVGCLVFIM